MEHLSFERKLKNTIESRMSEVSSLDEVYLCAEERQNRLFEIIFQECYYYAIFNYISSITLVNIEQKISQLQVIGVIKKEVNIEQFASIILDQTKSLDQKIELLKEQNFIIGYEYFGSRKEAESFLIENYELFGIKILDGNVKKLDRVIEKANYR